LNPWRWGRRWPFAVPESTSANADEIGYLDAEFRPPAPLWRVQVPWAITKAWDFRRSKKIIAICC